MDGWKMEKQQQEQKRDTHTREPMMEVKERGKV
jgi:hypothetical protein